MVAGARLETTDGKTVAIVDVPARLSELAVRGGPFDEATDGNATLDLVRNRSYDPLICDLIMPACSAPTSVESSEQMEREGRAAW